MIGRPMERHRGDDGRGYGAPGFAARFDSSRPSTPPILVDVLCQYARVSRPRLVVDLGCGTGHSTIVWADRAERVIGIEMEPAMLDVARGRANSPTFEWRQGFAHDTGLPNGGADVVTCVQAFHWMDPDTTLGEVARILSPGGVFAAVDWEMPAMDWEVEEADLNFIQTVRRFRREHGLAHADAADERRHWPKSGHLESIRRSGHFHYARELLFHGVEHGSAERLVLTASELVGEPWGALDALRERGVTDEDMGLTQLRAVAKRVIGEGCPWFIGYTARIGVRSSPD
jgi:ubiquinone/menaquinone biosynthesis C-methylase UbiE